MKGKDLHSSIEQLFMDNNAIETMIYLIQIVLVLAMRRGSVEEHNPSQKHM